MASRPKEGAPEDVAALNHVDLRSLPTPHAYLPPAAAASVFSLMPPVSQSSSGTVRLPKAIHAGTSK